MVMNIPTMMTYHHDYHHHHHDHHHHDQDDHDHHQQRVRPDLMISVKVGMTIGPGIKKYERQCFLLIGTRPKSRC